MRLKPRVPKICAQRVPKTAKSTFLMPPCSSPPESMRTERASSSVSASPSPQPRFTGETSSPPCRIAASTAPLSSSAMTGNPPKITSTRTRHPSSKPPNPTPLSPTLKFYRKNLERPGAGESGEHKMQYRTTSKAVFHKMQNACRLFLKFQPTFMDSAWPADEDA